MLFCELVELTCQIDDILKLALVAGCELLVVLDYVVEVGVHLQRNEVPVGRAGMLCLAFDDDDVVFDFGV